MLQREVDQAERCVKGEETVQDDAGDGIHEKHEENQSRDSVDHRCHGIQPLPQGGEAVRVLVMDTGPGIAAELLDAIFEPFVTTKAAGAGTGLGLAVSQAIVDGLGGTIKAWNPPNGGACFELLLPAA